MGKGHIIIVSTSYNHFQNFSENRKKVNETYENWNKIERGEERMCERKRKRETESEWVSEWMSESESERKRERKEGRDVLRM